MAATVIIEHCKISPPPPSPPLQDTSAAEFSLPLIFFDLMWYTFHANQYLLFYEIPNISKSHFLETIVPTLKHSLSLTLKHYLPLAGQIVHPSKPGNNKPPMFHYKPGVDYVSFVVAESNNDGSGIEFNHLITNQPRACGDFYAFAPQFPPAILAEDCITCPVMAHQVTIFPGRGVCLGSIMHHVVADASTAAMFMKAWACINKSLSESSSQVLMISSDDHDVEARLVECNCLPSYDRSTVIDINGLDSFSLEGIEKYTPVPETTVTFATHKSRATFILKKEQVQKLKNHVAARKNPDLSYVSSFTVVCGLVWMCSSRSDPMEDENEPEFFTFMADCRGRLNPPLPKNYFGNCVRPLKAELKHGEVTGENGFVMAVEAIGKAIRDTLYGDKHILYGAEDWDNEFMNDIARKRVYSVSGSPHFDFYGSDFGWGRPKTFEPLFIDGNLSISLFKSRDLEDGLEIGLSRTKAQMDAFVRVLNGVLERLIGSN